jgi:hypothetical protein
VRGDATYDNTKPSSVTQFALTGLSDSANAVLFYDKHGIQARVAYNWRAQFLSGTGPNPYYVEPYGQVDASASWEFRKGFTVFADAINLTNQGRRGHLRSDNNVFFASSGYARYSGRLPRQLLTRPSPSSRLALPCRPAGRSLAPPRAALVAAAGDGTRAGKSMTREDAAHP